MLPDDAARRGVEKLHEDAQLGAGRHLLAQCLLGVFQRQAGFVKCFVGPADSLYGFSAEATALQAFDIDAMRLGGISARHHERRHVAKNDRSTRGKCVHADAAELMDHGAAAEDDVVVDGNVPCERDLVCQDRVIADLRVMCNVDIGHDPVVRADTGYGDVLHGAGVERAEFADYVVIADFQAGGFARVFLVLGLFTENAVVEYAISLADAGMPSDHGVGGHGGAAADLDVLADDRIGSDFGVVRDLRTGVNDRHRVDHCAAFPESLFPGFARMVQSRLASETTTSSTSALAENFQMPRMARRICTLRIRRSPGMTGFLKRASSMPTK